MNQVISKLKEKSNISLPEKDIIKTDKDIMIQEK